MELLSATMSDGVMQCLETEGKDDSSEDKSSYKVVRKGDMVYNSMRTWQRADDVSLYDGIVSPACIVLIAKLPICNSYFATLFRNYKLINKFKKNSQGMTSDIWNSKYPQIETTRVYLPAIEGQEKIAFIPVTFDKRIAAQAVLIEQLKKYKRGVISASLNSKTNSYYSFEMWKEVALCDVTSGFEYGMNAATTVCDDSYKYIRITDIDDSSHLYSQDIPVSPEG